MKPRSLFAFASLCAIWGSTWAAIRMVVEEVPPLRAAVVRFSIAGAVLLVVAAGRGITWPRGEQLRALALMSLTMIALPYGLVFWAEQRVSSGMTAVLFAALPIFTAFLNPYIAPHPDKKEVPKAALQAMIVGLGGIALIVSGAISTSLSQGLGAAAVLAAVLLNSASTIYAKRALRDVSPVAGTSLQFLCAAAWLGMASFLMERGEAAVWSREVVGAMGFLILFGSVVAFTVYYWLLKQIEPYKLTTMQLIVPLVAVVEGLVLLREPVSLTMLGGAAVVLGSVIMVLRSREDEDEPITLRTEVP